MNACTATDAEREQRIAEWRAHLLAARTREDRRRCWSILSELLRARSGVQVMHLEIKRGLRR